MSDSELVRTGSHMEADDVTAEEFGDPFDESQGGGEGVR